MHREAIFSALIQQLTESLANATLAANQARELATHEQSKPETQYDTLGLEASYLAHGQSQRVQEIEQAISYWQTLAQKVNNDSDLVVAGDIVELLDQQGKSYYYLLGHWAGGTVINTELGAVQVISEQSPLGQKINHSSLGDEFSKPNADTEFLEIHKKY